MNKIKWCLNHPWELVVSLDLWLRIYPVPRRKRVLIFIISPLSKIAVRRWHPETLESPPGWSPKRWDKRSW